MILYSNQIESIPKDFSFPILKLLKISMNRITTFEIGYCPMLETIDAKDNLISQIEPLCICPMLKSFDVSFNQLQNPIPILSSLAQFPLTYLTSLKFNDNPCMQNRVNALEPYVQRLFPTLEVNSLQCKTSSVRPSLPVACYMLENRSLSE